jgi:elongation factor P hydroxylase
MPKTPSHKLFRLVKSLSGSEKRYFKIFVNPKGDKNNKYIRLFDLIDDQAIFNDEKLKKKIYGKKAVQGRKYSELKAYLYDLILKALQGYDEKTSVDYRLKSMMMSVRVLFKRSHFEDCKELLQKSKKLAKKHEQFHVVLEILAWQKKIAYAQSDMEYIGKNLGKISAEEKAFQIKIENLNNYRNIFLKLLMTLRQNVIRREKMLEKIQQIMSADILKNEENAQSNLAKILYNRIYAFYFYTISDIQKYYETNKYLLELMESLPHYLQEDLTEYIAVITNLSVSCGNLGKFEEIEECLQKLRGLSPNTHENQIYIHRQYYAFKLKLCIVKGEFEEGINEIELIPEYVAANDRHIFEKDSFYFSFFSIYFGKGDYNESLHYLNKWLNIRKSDERQDLQSLAKVLNLIIHYEMDNPILMDSIIRSNTRYLNKQKGSYQFEKILISFFSKVNKMPLTTGELSEAFQQLKDELLNDLQAPEEKRLLGIFDIISWIESKITNQSFSEIIKRKYNQRKVTMTS